MAPKAKLVGPSWEVSLDWKARKDNILIPRKLDLTYYKKNPPFSLGICNNDGELSIPFVVLFIDFTSSARAR